MMPGNAPNDSSSNRSLLGPALLAVYTVLCIGLGAYFYYVAFSNFWGFNVVSNERSTTYFFGPITMIGYAALFIGPAVLAVLVFAFPFAALYYAGQRFGKKGHKQASHTTASEGSPQEKAPPEADQFAMDAVGDVLASIATRVLLRVAAADGHISETERHEVEAQILQLFHNAPTAETVNAAIADIEAEPQGLERDLNLVGDHLDDEMKRGLLRSAVRVAIADANIHDAEWSLLMRLSSALGLLPSVHDHIVRQELSQAI